MTETPVPALPERPERPVGADDAGFGGKQVLAIVGITYRQLDYWARTDLLRPSLCDAKGSGSRRRYSYDDVVQLKVIKKLLDAGVSLQRIRTAMEFVRERGLSLRDITLMSDGKTVYALDDQQEIIDLLASGQGVFGIAVKPIYADVEAQVMRLPGERAHPAIPVTAEESAAAEG